jgi:hypothetical protein
MKNKKEKKRALWTFQHFIHHTQLGESVLPNVFLKRIQPSIATAGAATAGAGALPNTPLFTSSPNSREF